MLGAAAALAGAVLIVVAPRGWAQTASTADEPVRKLKHLSLEELFDLQVTSVSQKPESLSQTAAAIHVVTQEDIRRMGVLDCCQHARPRLPPGFAQVTK